MAGVLSFTLGLESSKFLSGADNALGRILALTGGALSLHNVFEKTFGAIERGGALTDLSNQTTESVKNLYSLEKAFEVVGGSAADVPVVIRNMSKALAGLDESGNKTDQLFAGMGLDMEALKAMDAPAQIEKITAALARMPKEQASAAAGQIFGRGAAGTALRIARDREGFSDTIKQVAPEAAAIDRIAAAFDKIGDQIVLMKSKMVGFWTGIAEGVVPLVNAIQNGLNAIDVLTLGKNIGTIISGSVQVFREGNFSELIATAIETGFSAGFSVIEPLTHGAGVEIIAVFGRVGASVVTIFEYAFEQLREVWTNMPWVDGPVKKGRSFSDIFSANQSEITNSDLLKGARADVAEQFVKGLAEGKDKLSALFAKIEEAAARSPELEKSKGLQRPDLIIPEALGKEDKFRMKMPEVTSLEKIGFVFNGGGSRENDFARATADNTQKMSKTLDAVRILLANPQTKAGFTNLS